MLRSIFVLLLTIICAGRTSAADVATTKRPHNVTLAFYLSAADGAKDEEAITASIKKLAGVSTIEFNRAAGYVQTVFDSHAISYQQVAQAIADAGKQTSKKYDPRLKVRVPEYPLAQNAAKIDALFAGKRLNQRVHIEAADKSKGDFVVHFLPLELDPLLAGPQGFNGGHLNHPIHDPPPRGLGLTCIYGSEKTAEK